MIPYKTIRLEFDNSRKRKYRSARTKRREHRFLKRKDRQQAGRSAE